MNALDQNQLRQWRREGLSPLEIAKRLGLGGLARPTQVSEQESSILMEGEVAILSPPHADLAPNVDPEMITPGSVTPILEDIMPEEEDA